MTMRKYSMNYGAFLGLCLIAVAVILDAFGINERESFIPSLLTNSIIVIGIFYFIIQYRDTLNNKMISYPESLKLGTSLAFFSSIILSFYTLLNITFFESNYIENILFETEQAILKSNPEISDDDLDLALNTTEKLMQPHWIVIMSVLGGTFMGFLYSLVISFFTKRDK